MVNSHKKSSGSALLITIIIMGIASIIVFSIARTALFQVSNISTSEQSLGALYAAEAGVSLAQKSEITTSGSLPNGATYTFAGGGGGSGYTNRTTPVPLENNLPTNIPSQKYIIKDDPSGSTIRIHWGDDDYVDAGIYVIVESTTGHWSESYDSNGSVEVSCPNWGLGCTINVSYAPYDPATGFWYDGEATLSGLWAEVISPCPVPTCPLPNPFPSLIETSGSPSTSITATGSYGKIIKQIIFDPTGTPATMIIK